MKTTLWTRDEMTRARPLLERMDRDLTEALARTDEAVQSVRLREAAFERVKPKLAAPCWIELVHAQEELDDALLGLGRLSAEVRALNGRLALDRGAGIDLAGEEDGVLVYWSLDAGSLRAEPALALEAVAA